MFKHGSSFLLVTTVGVILCLNSVVGIFEFPKANPQISPADRRTLSQIKEDQIKAAVELGVQSVKQEERLEANLISSDIVVVDGSVSHAQLLETFPNEEARNDDYIARQILKSSLYLFNGQCVSLDVNKESCSNYISQISIPDSELKQKCLNITSSFRDGHHAYRRLLKAGYADGLQMMVNSPNIPKPRQISSVLLNNHHGDQFSENTLEDESVSLPLIQWAQFIEHDLSKPAVRTMNDGTPIECCNSDFYKLSPRYVHPACAPLEGTPASEYDWVPCLNFVRSALVVDPQCKFGPAKQLNQASSSLDLSQLYGYTKELRDQMRSFENGELKTTESSQGYPESFLPLAINKDKFCAISQTSNDQCFMAGDNRVNSNPFVNIAYTIFLRSHNNIAKTLKEIHPNWDDEQLYNEAKQQNIEVYRFIVYNEWLPSVLGKNITKEINSGKVQTTDMESGVSNEFAVAAIRFYYSMMPNELLVPRSSSNALNHGNPIIVSSNSGEMNPNELETYDLDDLLLPSRSADKIFDLRDQFYKSDFIQQPGTFEITLEAMLRQNAMKMDSKYAESLTQHFLRTNSTGKQDIGSDALAWDIQRGRDHGVASYVKYLEICEQVTIRDFDDLSSYMRKDDIDRLKTVYRRVEDVDLIVGGISEKPKAGSILGPTFSCILAEQFSNLKHFEKSPTVEALPHDYSAHKLLCETTSLLKVPRDIFKVPSVKNPMKPCLITKEKRSRQIILPEVLNV